MRDGIVEGGLSRDTQQRGRTTGADVADVVHGQAPVPDATRYLGLLDLENTPVIAYCALDQSLQ